MIEKEELYERLLYAMFLDEVANENTEKLVRHLYKYFNTEQLEGFTVFVEEEEGLND